MQHGEEALVKRLRPSGADGVRTFATGPRRGQRLVRSVDVEQRDREEERRLEPVRRLGGVGVGDVNRSQRRFDGLAEAHRHPRHSRVQRQGERLGAWVAGLLGRLHCPVDPLVRGRAERGHAGQGGVGDEERTVARLGEVLCRGREELGRFERALPQEQRTAEPPAHGGAPVRREVERDELLAEDDGLGQHAGVRRRFELVHRDVDPLRASRRQRGACALKQPVGDKRRSSNRFGRGASQPAAQDGLVVATRGFQMRRHRSGCGAAPHQDGRRHLVEGAAHDRREKRLDGRSDRVVTERDVWPVCREQPAPDALVDRRQDARRRQVDHGADVAETRRGAQHRRRPQDHDRERCGGSKPALDTGGERAGEEPGGDVERSVVAGVQLPGVHVAEQLDEEQGVPAGGLQQGAEVRSRRRTHVRRGQCGHCVASKRVQRDRVGRRGAHVAPLAFDRRVWRAGCGDDEEPVPLEPAGHRAQREEGGRVGPVEVVDHDGDGPVESQLLDQPAQRLDGSMPQIRHRGEDDRGGRRR